MGRRVPQEHAEYTPARFREWNDRSRENLGVERLDLVQLHCPPTAVIEDDALFAELDAFVEEGRIAAYGVSVETCDQALAAIARPRVATVQIILNAFRLKPLERVLPAAREAGVGIIGARAARERPARRAATRARRRSEPTITARTTGTARRSTSARRSPGSTSRPGSRRCGGSRRSCPRASTMAQWALRLVLDQPGVSVVIPGARNAEQARGERRRGVTSRRSRPTISRPCSSSTTS